MPRRTSAWELSCLLVDFFFLQSYDPLSTTSAKNKIQEKSQISFCIEKQMVPCKSTAEKVSFEWSHYRPTESKVRTTSRRQVLHNILTLEVEGLSKYSDYLTNYVPDKII